MFATIYLPNFYLQAAMRHQPGLCAKPVALIEEQEKKPVIVQLNDTAEKAGIYKGMTPSQSHDNVLRVIEQLAECEISAQAGIAPTPDTSFLAAHLAKPVLQIENAKEFLAPLPIETLAMIGAT